MQLKLLLLLVGLCAISCHGVRSENEEGMYCTHGHLPWREQVGQELPFAMNSFHPSILSCEGAFFGVVDSLVQTNLPQIPNLT